MPVALLATPSVPSTPKQAVATDNANGDASAGEDFANLLQDQLSAGSGQAPAAAASAPVTALPAAATAQDAGQDEDADALSAIGADTSALLATFAMVTPPVSAEAAPTAVSAESTEIAALSAPQAASPFVKSAQTKEEAPASASALPETSDTSDTSEATKIDVAAAKFAVAPASIENKTSTENESADSVSNGVELPTHNVHANAEKNVLHNDSSLSVSTPVRDQEWSSEFGQKVVWLASADKQSAQLTLNPAEMGPIEISLSMDKGNATVSFVSANAEVRDSIETALPKLREMFASAGIELGQTNVGAESFRQQSGNGEGNPSPSRSISDNAILAGDTALPLQSRSFSAQQGNGLVDLFA